MYIQLTDGLRAIWKHTNLYHYIAKSSVTPGIQTQQTDTQKQILWGQQTEKKTTQTAQRN